MVNSTKVQQFRCLAHDSRMIENLQAENVFDTELDAST